MHLTSKQILKGASLLVGVALVAGMLISFNLNRAAIYNELVTFDLIAKPEKLTELYFNDNANLPVSATGNQEIDFVFVIHNLETTDYQYNYVVFVNVGGTRFVVDHGTVAVKNNQYYVKNESFRLSAAPGSQKVVVELTNKQQSIDFWVGKPQNS